MEHSGHSACDGGEVCKWSSGWDIMGQDKGNCMYGNADVVRAMGDSADGSYVGKATRNVCGGALIWRVRYIIECANEGGTRD